MSPARGLRIATLLGASAICGGCVTTSQSSPVACVHDVLGCPRDVERTPGVVGDGERAQAAPREAKHSHEKGHAPSHEARTPKR